MFQRRNLPAAPAAEHEHTTDTPTLPEDFFQPGTEYRLNRDYEATVLTHFRCEAVEWDADTGGWIACGQWAQGALDPRVTHRLNEYEWSRGWVAVRRLVPPTPADIARGLS
ncbi:hypothetical protein GCM10010400_58000 [Streptomyces aculeolatus]|uniref:hypothetical protein n=1 Tax=Streptomyces aculeolatus TaxID=270689 RepID=UPI001CECF9A0|nr:hypothetical protein [Streptomyces aculeolatus]